MGDIILNALRSSLTMFAVHLVLFGIFVLVPELIHIFDNIFSTQVLDRQIGNLSIVVKTSIILTLYQSISISCQKTFVKTIPLFCFIVIMNLHSQMIEIFLRICFFWGEGGNEQLLPVDIYCLISIVFELVYIIILISDHNINLGQLFCFSVMAQCSNLMAFAVVFWFDFEHFSTIK